ncbi:HD-GYP domain-containing protein [Peribacillus glennii]|uniref:HD-GYP domain-containing protein n=1 Tax=Peribacillus glennii TaxID=2303991 RepID=A0A372LGP5_9BACI|nr:HD-GYP domain-containing protein [Peribacillus glennii]RFU65478.1 HD-GYP domain-containing protein [Peribacillus glennii]
MTSNKRPAIHNNLTPLTIQEIDTLILRMKQDGKGNASCLINEGNDILTVPEKIKKISLEVETASRKIKDIFHYVRDTENLPMDEIRNDILPIIQRAAEIPHIYYLFKEIQLKDEYTYNHNISVGIIATLTGKWMGLQGAELQRLTLAATLHDVGKMKISDDILHKPGKFTAGEFEEMKKHTIYGYELLKQVPGEPVSIALTALQHHERENGEGYPFGLKGHDMHLFSKIVAVADVFHAMSSDRVYHDAIPFYQVISQMNKDVFGKFDPNVLLVFMNRMMGALVGKKVLLTNSEYGEIILINPYQPLQSLIKTERGIIDLKVEKAIEIQKVIG